MPTPNTRIVLNSSGQMIVQTTSDSITWYDALTVDVAAGDITLGGSLDIPGGFLEARSLRATVTNIIADVGNIIATLGDITATAGNITATAGDITATAGNITATAGDITATAGAVAAGTTVTATGGLITGLNSALVTSNVAMLDGAGAGAGTIANAPAAGNPTKWVPIDDNGTTRYVPAW